MKQVIITLLIAVAVVYALYIWNESSKRRAVSNAQYESEIVRLKDSLHIYSAIDSALRVRIAHKDDTLVMVRDSIKLYQSRLNITKTNYETIIANMFHWSDSEHIRFFSNATDSIK